MLGYLQLGYYLQLAVCIIKQITQILFFINFFLSSCVNTDIEYKIYINGNIFSGISKTNRLEYIAIKDDKILDIGIGNYGHLINDRSEIIDLEYNFVVPGFMDNHTHFMSSGTSLMTIKLHDCKTKASFIKKFKYYVNKLVADECITGGSWDHENWGGHLPNKNWIDETTINNPVVF